MSNEINADDASCIGSDMSLTITERNLVKRIAQLEADKAELLKALIITNNYILFEPRRKFNAALIQKHAAK